MEQSAEVVPPVQTDLWKLKKKIYEKWKQSLLDHGRGGLSYGQTRIDLPLWPKYEGISVWLA